MFKQRSSHFRVLIIDSDQTIHHELEKILVVPQKNHGFAPQKDDNNFFPAFQIDLAVHFIDVVNLIMTSLKNGTPYAIAFINEKKEIKESLQVIKDIWQMDKNIQIAFCMKHVDDSWDQLINQFGFEDDLMFVEKPFVASTVRQLTCVLAKKWQIMQLQIMHQKLLEGQLEQTEKEYQHSLTHDPVTNLPNRLLLVDRINHAISHANHVQTIFSLFLINIDRFVLINDSLGRVVGDQLLRGLAGRLKALTEEWDATLARVDGDEFIILLENINNDEQTTFFIEKLLQLVKSPFTINQQEFSVTACVGIGLFPKDGSDAETLLKNIDIALLKAKEQGPNSFQFYRSNMTSHSLEQLKLENQLRKAFELNQFLLYYQPQFDLKTREFISVEALVRWQHPEKGIISPIEFISSTEESGLIVPLGEWVLETACRQCVAWQKSGLKPFRIAVNMAQRQVGQSNFVDVVKHVLHKTKLDPQFLELELTENMIINSEDTIEKIKQLKKMGIKIALDDYGSGFSSISYLKKVPLDRIKIDREYIQNILINSDDEAIVCAIIALAKSLNLRVLAEGVESVEQINFLLKNDCNEVQGSWLGVALPPEELEAMLGKAKVKMTELLTMVGKAKS